MILEKKCRSMLTSLDKEISYIQDLKKRTKLENKAIIQLNGEIDKLKKLKVICLCKLIKHYEIQALKDKTQGAKNTRVTYASEKALGVGTKTIDAIFSKAMFILSFAMAKRIEKQDVVYVEYKGEVGYGTIRDGSKA